MDFCAKYSLQANETEHFVAFKDKLRNNGQTDEQCRQARRTLAIYYRGVDAIPHSSVNKPVLSDAGNPVKGSPI